MKPRWQCDAIVFGKRLYHFHLRGVIKSVFSYSTDHLFFGCRFGCDSFVFWPLHFYNAAMRDSVDAQLKDIWSRKAPGNVTV